MVGGRGLAGGDHNTYHSGQLNMDKVVAVFVKIHTVKIQAPERCSILWERIDIRV